MLKHLFLTLCTFVPCLLASADSPSAATYAEPQSLQKVIEAEESALNPPAPQIQTQDCANILQNVSNSVVRIMVSDGKTIASGSGFFVSNDGMLITNEHVVSGMSRILVLVLNKDKTSARAIPAVLIRVDKQADLALLKIETKEATLPLELATTDAKVLDEVVALGFPAAIDTAMSRNIRFVNGYADDPSLIENLIPNITKGAISKITEQSITHDAKISHGSSGGPLISISTGYVLGVNVAGVSDKMTTFYMAIPVSKVKALLERTDELQPFFSPDNNDSKDEANSEIFDQTQDDTLTNINFEDCVKRADNGDADAQLVVAKCYRQGVNTDKSLEKAFHYYELSANQGNVESMIGLAHMYRYGFATQADKGKYVELLMKAADADSTQACLELADYSFDIACITKDKDSGENAFKYYKKGLELGDERFTFGLGRCYECGVGTALSKPQAKEYLQRAHVFFNRPAISYYYGLALTKSSDPGDFSKGIEILENCAKAGNAKSQLLMGKRYLNGDGVEEDIQKAVSYLTASAKQGNPMALCSLADMYYRGLGVSKDYDTAMILAEEARKLGNIRSYAYLVFITRERGDVYNEIRYLQEGAKKGNGICALILGDYYLRGTKVPKNRANAIKWYRICVSHEDTYTAAAKEAEKFLKKIGESVDEKSQQRKRTSSSQKQEKPSSPKSKSNSSLEPNKQQQFRDLDF